MFKKKTQGISSNLFVPDRKFSNFLPGASTVLRNFPTFPTLDFSQFSEALGKRPKFHVNVRQGEWVVRFVLLLGYHLIHISFLQNKLLRL